MSRSTVLLPHASAVAILALILSTSCSLKVGKNAPVSSATAHPAKDLAVKPDQVRLRMRSLVEPFAGEIEHAADAIAAGTSDRSVKRAAIQWKIEGVPAIRGSLFQPDPFTAVFDTWVLTNQMANYFESGPGRTTLGTAAPLAVQACLRMEAEVTKAAESFTYSHDVSKALATAKQWAIDHPIRYAIRDRETSLSRVQERDAGLEWNTGEIIAVMAATADDLHREIQIYSDHLFRQARWEAELLAVDLPTTEVLPLAERAVKSSERAVDTLDRLTPSIASAASAAEKAADAASNAASKLPSDIPAFVTSERKGAVEAITEDLRATLTFMHSERLGAMDQINTERLAAMNGLHEERIAVMNGINDERIAVMKDVREIATDERRALSQDLEQAGLKLVDHAAWRLTEIVAATLISILVGTLLLLFLIRRLFFSSANPRDWQNQQAA